MTQATAKCKPEPLADDAYKARLRADIEQSENRLQQPPAAKPARRPVLKTLAEVQPLSVEWLRPGWLPLNAVTVLDGDPGLGKSTITLDWAAEATRAGSDVLLLSAEDNLDSTLRPRIEAAGADMDRVHSLEAVETDDGEEPPVLPYDIPLLEELIVAHKVKLVIIDPLMAYLDGKIHSHHDQDMRRVLHRLKMLAQKHHVAIVLIRHLNKDDSTRNPLYRGGGSIGISAAVRSALLVARAPDNPEQFILAQCKNNWAPLAVSHRYIIETVRLPSKRDIETSRIKWLGEAHFEAADLMASSAAGPDPLADAEDFLREALAAAPQPQANVVQQAIDKGISERTLDRAKAKIGVQSVRSGRTWNWQLPPPPDGQGRQPNPLPSLAPLIDIADSHNLFPGGHQ